MRGISSHPFAGGELLVYVDDLDQLLSAGNADVEVIDAEGGRWAATFFTLDGVETLFQKNAVTGECAGGTYLWASEMILVRALTVDVIERTIADLRKSGEFESAFARLSSDGGGRT